MTMQLAIAVAGIIGLLVGLAIGRKAIKERDEKIKELENKLKTNQNVMDAQNATIGRLRKKLKKKGNEDTDGDN